jgi:uncharacterized membrane protein
MLALRYVYVLALAVWLGGMILLGAIVAPATFQVLQAAMPDAGRALAGDVFGTMLARFHYVAYAAGALLIVTLFAMRLLGPRPHGVGVRVAIVTAMLASALYSGLVVSAQIDAVQQESAGLPSRLPETDARRIRFDELHQLSTRLMLLNIVGAFALLYWEARER